MSCTVGTSVSEHTPSITYWDKEHQKPGSSFRNHKSVECMHSSTATWEAVRQDWMANATLCNTNSINPSPWSQKTAVQNVTLSPTTGPSDYSCQTSPAWLQLVFCSHLLQKKALHPPPTSRREKPRSIWCFQWQHGFWTHCDTNTFVLHVVESRCCICEMDCFGNWDMIRDGRHIY